MSPEDLAARHPRLYHLTTPEALGGIERHGLLPTSALLGLFEVPADARAAIERDRRPTSVALAHAVYGRATITDNVPLTMPALARCLDDGLSASDWLAMLNARVFFWADEASLAGLLAARLNRGRPRAVLVLDTLGVARAHAARMELSAINTGATLRRPARRGLATFTPLLSHDYPAWRRLRGRLDRVREVTVLGGVPDLARYLIDVRHVTGG